MVSYSLARTVFCSCFQIINYQLWQLPIPHPPFLSQKTCMEPTFMDEQSKRNHSNQRSPTTKQLQAALLWLAFQIMAITNYGNYQFPPPFLSQKTYMEPTFMNEQSKRNHGNQRSHTTKQLRAALLGLAFKIINCQLWQLLIPRGPRFSWSSMLREICLSPYGPDV